MSHWQSGLWQLVCGEEGQDLVEYAYLTLFIALATAATLVVLQTAISAAYSGSNGAVDGLWQPPDPAAGI